MEVEGVESLYDKRLSQASHRRAPVDEVIKLVDWVAFAGDPNSIFSAMGLIGDGSGNSCEDPNRVAAPRVAYYTFKRLAENLDSGNIELIGAIDLGLGADDAGGAMFKNRLTGRKIYVLYTNYV